MNTVRSRQPAEPQPPPMTSRERVRRALNFEVPDRLPKDLSGMRSTGISAFAYPKLVAALGLPPRLPCVYDTGQMLALPDLDVLDALGIDVVTVQNGATNAFPEPEKWHPFNFNGRLPARVRRPGAFRTEPDGTIVQGAARMPPSAVTFDELHAGQFLSLSGELPKPDLRKLARDLDAQEVRDEYIQALGALCRRAHEESERAVFLDEGAIMPPISIHSYGGLAIFPILCLTEPGFVADLHGIATEYALKNIRRLVPVVGPYVDVVMTAADDWGNQQNLMAPPRVYRDLFLPYRRRINDEVHRLAPGAKTFLHSCGAIFTLIDMVIESGFDILNPVQWSAGKHSHREWKDQSRGRIALWGGGVNSQITLPLGTVADVAREVSDVVRYLAQDGGYVFCNIHNILAEIPPEKVIALYRAADRAAL